MDLKDYKSEELLISAMKAEEESAHLYGKLSRKTRNKIMAQQLRFLASEEQKHHDLVRRLYIQEFKRKPPMIKQMFVRSLMVEFPGPGSSRKDILKAAMKAERAAEEFYVALRDNYPAASDEAFLLTYFANMEKGHFVILKNQRDLLIKARDEKRILQMD